MPSTAPTEIHDGVIRLCKKIGATETPVYVPIIPEEDSMPQWCYQNVDAKIKREGGQKIQGWCIWEDPNVLIEGEHHAVWKSPSGELTCVSRRTDGDTRLLFLPDNRINYDGLPVGSIRMSWPKNRHTERYIEKVEAFERFKVRHMQRHTHILNCDHSEFEYHVREVENARKRIHR